MSDYDREQRFQKAIAEVKWWSEIVGIFSAWAVVIGVTFLSNRILNRMPAEDHPDYNFYLYMANGITFLLLFAVFAIYSLRMAWLVYCWVSKLHDGSRGWFARATDYIGTAVIVSALMTGLFTMAVTIANSQMGS